MIRPFSLFSNKIETHSSLSYLLHLPYLLYGRYSTGVAQRQRAGLITPRTQDQSLSPVFSISVALLCYRTIPLLLDGVFRNNPSLLSDVKHCTKPIHRCGAEVARGAHNSEVTRSKRVSGILPFARFIVLPHNPPCF
jgi:hypothetical protein